MYIVGFEHDSLLGKSSHFFWTLSRWYEYSTNSLPCDTRQNYVDKYVWSLTSPIIYGRSIVQGLFTLFWNIQILSPVFLLAIDIILPYLKKELLTLLVYHHTLIIRHNYFAVFVFESFVYSFLKRTSNLKLLHVVGNLGNLSFHPFISTNLHSDILCADLFNCWSFVTTDFCRPLLRGWEISAHSNTFPVPTFVFPTE